MSAIFILRYFGVLYFLPEQAQSKFTTAEFNGLSSVAYRNGILSCELKILVKIYLDIVCAHMVNFCRPGHNIPKFLPIMKTFQLGIMYNLQIL